MKINSITTRAELSEALPAILHSPHLGIDTETSGYTPRVGDIALLQLAVTPEEIYVLNVPRLVREGERFEFLKDTLASEQINVFQNAKFDLQFIQKLVGSRLRVRNLNDTMIASQLLAFGDKRVRHSLAAIAERELGESVDKGLQRSDFSGDTFTPEQIEYAARDAGVVLRIREAQLKKINDAGLRRCARLEFDAVAVLAEMEYFGMYLDTEMWLARAADQRERYLKLEDEILKIIGTSWPVQTLWETPSINLASPKQLKEALQRLNIKVLDTDEDTLKELVGTHPIIDKLLEFREVETAGKKFGEAYMRFVDPVTGRIHPSFWQIEAPTGRMSCRDPNLMQVPSRGPYRAAFRAGTPDGKIITADYSQIELRVMARLSGDEVLTQAFTNGEDLHNKTCHLVLGEPLENPDPDKRTIAKNLNFGTAYGASPATFARLAKITESEAAKLLDDYWRVYRGLDRYLTHQGRVAVQSGVMRTASGRTGKLLFDTSDPSMRGRASRLGRNYSIQGTGADILKRGLFKFREAVLDRELDCFVVNCVHDEIVVEAPSRAEEVAELLQDTMNEAAAEYLDPIPCKVDVRVKEHWSK